MDDDLGVGGGEAEGFSSGFGEAPATGFEDGGGAAAMERTGESASLAPTPNWEDLLVPPEKEEAPAAPDLPADAIPIAQELAREARAAGFESVESFVQARIQEQAAAEQRQTRQREEQRWLGEAHRNLQANYQAKVNAGELTPQQATELYARDMAVTQYHRTQERASLDMSMRQIEQDIHQAATANPLLSLDDGLAGSLIRALSLSGMMPTQTVVGVLNRFAQSVEQKAVADYVAKEAEKSKNAAPVIRAGGGASRTGGAAENGNIGDWADFLFRRSGIR